MIVLPRETLGFEEKNDFLTNDTEPKTGCDLENITSLWSVFQIKKKSFILLFTGSNFLQKNKTKTKTDLHGCKVQLDKMNYVIINLYILHEQFGSMRLYSEPHVSHKQTFTTSKT